MGHYHLICNLDKKQYINPPHFDSGDGYGHGMKLLEFGSDQMGPMTGLAILLAEQNKGRARGGGDLHPWNGGPGYEGSETPKMDPAEEERLMTEIVGSWAGDRITIIGDYWNPDDPVASSVEGGPWGTDLDNPEEWTDISKDVVKTIELDFYIHRHRNQARESSV